MVSVNGQFNLLLLTDAYWNGWKYKVCFSADHYASSNLTH